MTHRKNFIEEKEGDISEIDLREVNPLRRTGGTVLRGQVPRVVIQHRCKVEDNKHKPAERYL
jgi:hypothetical protein